MPAVGAVILAAGASTRLGRPKQLLMVGGQTLLRRVVNAALASACAPVVVVLGAHAARIAPEVAGTGVIVAENPDWAAGMASSIRVGLAALTANAPASDLDAALFLVCDQPHVSSPLLNALIERYETTAAPIAACAYGGGLGVPALFARELFGELASLSGAEGARAVIMRHAPTVARVDFSEGALDIDTDADYRRLFDAPG